MTRTARHRVDGPAAFDDGGIRQLTLLRRKNGGTAAALTSAAFPAAGWRRGLRRRCLGRRLLRAHVNDGNDQSKSPCPDDPSNDVISHWPNSTWFVLVRRGESRQGCRRLPDTRIRLALA